MLAIPCVAHNSPATLVHESRLLTLDTLRQLVFTVADSLPMDDTAVLAKPFVPANIRTVNNVVPDHFLYAPGIPTIDEDIRELQSSLQPLPECRCTSTTHDLRIPQVDGGSEAMIKKLTKDLKATNLRGKIKSVDKISDTSDYIHTFSALLQVERQELLNLYERYSQYNVKVKLESPTQAHIAAPGIADAKPPIYPGDTILLRPLRRISVWNKRRGWSRGHHQVQIQAMVVSVTRMKKDVISFTWMSPDDQREMAHSYPENVYNVIILPSSSMYVRCLTALNWLSRLPLEVSNHLLFPNEAPAVDAVDDSKLNVAHLSHQLNTKQELFVRLVKSRTLRPSMDVVRSPMVLTGPAGTGKTQALLHGIFEVLKLSSDHRVLVCTPSHTAADVVTRRLAERLNREELWRLLDSDRPVKTVPASILPFTRQRTDTGAFRLPATTEELYSFRVIVCTCSDANVLYRLEFTNQQLRVQRQCFLSYAKETCQKLNLKVSKVAEGASNPHFTHLFIDEASQATEPEIMIALSIVVDHSPDSVKAEIALIGDPRQLSPDIYSNEAAEAGLGQSYMERLLQRPMNYLTGGWPYMLGLDDEEIPYDMQHKRSSVFLTANYRGHASFLMMPSSLFYFDKLQVVGSNSAIDWTSKLRCVEALSMPVTGLALKWNRYSPSSISAPSLNFLDPTILQLRRQETWPVHFRGVVGQDAAVGIEAFAGSNSWCNRQEAEVVAKIVVTLTSNGVKSSSIGIMSPFRGQVVLIRKLLRDVNLAGVDVGTIEDYQAVERDTIILSLTRSSSKFLPHDVAGRAGVFQQMKRTNVAMTRAEHLFIVVGNPNLMVQDPIWRQWLWFCLRNGFWYGEQIEETWLDEMHSKPIGIARFRHGETHSLLGLAGEKIENLVLMSTLELERRMF